MRSGCHWTRVCGARAATAQVANEWNSDGGRRRYTTELSLPVRTAQHSVAVQRKAAARWYVCQVAQVGGAQDARLCSCSSNLPWVLASGA